MPRNLQAIAESAPDLRNDITIPEVRMYMDSQDKKQKDISDTARTRTALTKEEKERSSRQLKPKVNAKVKEEMTKEGIEHEEEGRSAKTR